MGHLRLISLMDNIRCRSTRVIYGDQAMFVRRSLFEQLGGFPALPFLEDVAFCQSLVQHTRPLILDLAAVTDSRKFEQAGVWRSLWRCAVIMRCVRRNRPLGADALAFFQDLR